MKRILATLLALVSLACIALAQEAALSPYKRMLGLYQSGVTDEKLSAFVSSLSKDEFRQLLRDFAEENAGVSQGMFETMSVLSIPYYQQGAGKNDGYGEWAQDVMDRSYPSAWRDVILGHPPAKAHPVSEAQQKDFQDMLFSIFRSLDEDVVLRREALLKLSGVVKYDSLSADQLGGYLACLKEIVTTPDQHRGFFQTALREIDHVIDSGKETAAKGPDPAIAKAVAAGDTAAVASDKDLPAEQKQFFTQVAGLSKDFGAILDGLSSSTNLPNYLQSEVGKLKEKRSVPSTL